MMFALSTTARLGTSRIALAKIDAVVASKLGLTRVRGNAQPAVFNRQIAMYLAKQVGGWSTTRIGRFYNGRDHSTVCHAIKKIQVLRDSNSEVDLLLSELIKEIETVSHNESGRINLAVSASPRPGVVEALWTDELLDNLADRIAGRLRSQRTCCT